MLVRIERAKEMAQLAKTRYTPLRGIAGASLAERASLGLQPNSRLKTRLKLEASVKQRSSAMAEIDWVAAGFNRTVCASSSRSRWMYRAAPPSRSKSR
jgi:hypothetical protein